MMESGLTAEEVNPIDSSIRRFVSARIRLMSRKPSEVVSSRPVKMLRHSVCCSASARS